MSSESDDRGHRGILSALRDHPKVSLAMLISVISLLPFVGTIRAGYVIDDSRAVLQNPVVQGDFDLTRLFTTDMWGQAQGRTHGGYRPLVVLSFIIDHRIGGGEPWMFHLTNLLLHMVTSVLVFIVLLHRMSRLWIAAVAACLFAVHAIHTESISSIVGRADIMATLIGLLAWRAWMSKRLVWGLAGGLLFFVALLAKEVAVAFLAILVFDIALSWKGSEKRLQFVKLGGACAGLAAYIVLRVLAFGTFVAPVKFLANPLIEATISERLFTVAALFSRTASLLIAPLVLSADYSYAEIIPLSEPWHLDVVFGLCLSILVPAWAIAARRKRQAVTLGLVFLGVAYLPVSNLFLLIPTIFSERLLYLPSLGFCLALAAVLVAAKARLGKAAPFCLVALLVSHGIGGAIGSEKWIDEDVLLSATVRTSPNSVAAWYNLGVKDLDAERYDDAIRHLNKSVSIHSGWSKGHTNLGIALEMTGRSQESLHAFTKALVEEPTCSICAANLVHFYLKHRRLVSARGVMERFEKAGGDAETLERMERWIKSAHRRGVEL